MTTVIVWVVTTQLGGVKEVFGGSLYECGANGFFFFLVTCGERYQVAARSPGTLELSSDDYVGRRLQ
ncbi:hypothetical protein PC128_g11083 [Phytophthora cactorum]|nr:hypothetical protein PC128_g11083 [Phytophthora cactorum]